MKNFTLYLLSACLLLSLSASSLPLKAINDPQMNYPPQATALNIIGEQKVGETMTAKYKYFDQEGNPEGKTIVNWYGRDDMLNTEKLLTENTVSFTPGPEHGDLRIRFKVLPKSREGNSSGVIVSSAYTAPLLSDYPVLKMQGVYARSDDYLNVGGRIYSNSKNTSNVTEYGIICERIGGKKKTKRVKLGSGFAEVNDFVKGLDPNTSYSIRLYAKSGKETYYSDEFKTYTLNYKNQIYKLTPQLPAYEGMMSDDISISGDVLIANVSRNSCIDRFFIYHYYPDTDKWKLNTVISRKDFKNSFFTWSSTNGDYFFVNLSKSGKKKNGVGGSDKLAIFKRKNDSWKFNQFLEPETEGGEVTNIFSRKNELYVTCMTRSSFTFRVKYYSLNESTGKWILEQTLMPPDPELENWDLMNSPVVADGDHLIISGHTRVPPYNNNYLHFYSRNMTSNTWEHQSSIKIEKDEDLDNPGALPKSIEGNLLAVGRNIIHPINDNHWITDCSIMTFSYNSTTGAWGQGQTIMPANNSYVTLGDKIIVHNSHIYASYYRHAPNDKYGVHVYKMNNSGKFKLSKQDVFKPQDNPFNYYDYPFITAGDIASTKDFLAIAAADSDSDIWAGAVYLVKLNK